MHVRECRTLRWSLASGRGELEVCIVEGAVSGTIRDGEGGEVGIHGDDLNDWFGAFREARSHLKRPGGTRPCNAFKRWSVEADALLVEGSSAGMSPEELAQELGRTPNAVRLRMEESGVIPSESHAPD
jgi:hypothetical protein